jgi:hypothetical protein
MQVHMKDSCSSLGLITINGRRKATSPKYAIVDFKAIQGRTNDEIGPANETSAATIYDDGNNETDGGDGTPQGESDTLQGNYDVQVLKICIACECSQPYRD